MWNINYIKKKKFNTERIFSFSNSFVYTLIFMFEGYERKSAYNRQNNHWKVDQFLNILLHVSSRIQGNCTMRFSLGSSWFIAERRAGRRKRWLLQPLYSVQLHASLTFGHCIGVRHCGFLRRELIIINIQ